MADYRIEKKAVVQLTLEEVEILLQILRDQDFPSGRGKDLEDMFEDLFNGLY